MDRYLQQYLAGETITVYVRGKPSQDIPNFPPWVADLLEIVSIPVPVPGRKGEDGTDKMVKSFGLSRVKITLPPRVPGDAPALPRISALVNAVIELPKELDFSVSINKLCGSSDMYYQGDKFGVLVISEWIPAQSFYTPEGYIQVVAEMADVPMEITDQDVFKKIVQQMFFSGEAYIDMRGTIDVALEMPVGEFAIRNIPVKSSVAVRGYPSSMAELSGLEKIKDDWNQFVRTLSNGFGVDQSWQDMERESRLQWEAAVADSPSDVREVLELSKMPSYDLQSEAEPRISDADIAGYDSWNTVRTTVTLDTADRDDFVLMFSGIGKVPSVVELYKWNPEPDTVRVCVRLSEDRSAKEMHVVGHCDASFSYLDFLEPSYFELNKKMILQKMLSTYRAKTFDDAEE
ncbi:hypothetical protein V1506DRAFT_259330 [Lipomyces tetrasporus]